MQSCSRLNEVRGASWSILAVPEEETCASWIALRGQCGVEPSNYRSSVSGTEFLHSFCAMYAGILSDSRECLFVPPVCMWPIPFNGRERLVGIHQPC